MLTISTLDISTYDKDSLTIDWTWASHSEDEDDYTVTVYRSENLGASGSLTNYTEVATVAADAGTYEDTGISGLYHPGRTWYYKLLLTNTETLDTSHLTPTPIYKYYESDDYAYNNIIMRKSLVINKKSGRTYYLLKRRSWGTRCTTCWDSTLMRVTDPDCPECRGTGWTGGFFDPLSFKAMMTPAPKYNQITMFGEWMPSDSLLIMLNYPILTVKDVLVDDGNVRWMVKNVRPIQKLGYNIEQQAQITRISEDDPVYDIEVS